MKEKTKMLNLNKVFVCGRLTANPELKITSPGNKKVCSFNIACNAAKNITYYFAVVAWESRGEFVAVNFRKGSPIFIEGELVQRKYTAKDGKSVSVIEIRALDIKFVETLEEKNARMAAELPETPAVAVNEDGFVSVDISTDDLPF